MDLATETNCIQVIVSYMIRTPDFFIDEENIPYWLAKNEPYENSPIFQQLFLVRVNPVVNELETIYAIVKRKTKATTLILTTKQNVGYCETVLLPGKTEDCTITINHTVITM